MKTMRINWNEIRHRMIERGIRNQSQLTRVAGIHANAFKQDGAFLSDTLDKIAHVLGCDPRELIMLEEVESNET